MTTFVELYAGMASVSLHLFGLKPPVSRIGNKTGYAEAICDVLKIRRKKVLRLPDGSSHELHDWGFIPGVGAIQRTQFSIDQVLLVDQDPWVCCVLRALCSGHGPKVAAQLAKRTATKACWERTREAMRQSAVPERWDSDATRIKSAAMWLYVTAASRGGIGGFKGEHKLRPSVKGWIPTISSLCERLQAFDRVLPVEVLCARAEDIAPFRDSIVYLDPPYEGRTGYGGRICSNCGGAHLARVAHQWLSEGATVALSSPRRTVALASRLGAEHRTIELTHRRKGQTRRSMTKNSAEYLHVFEPKS